MNVVRASGMVASALPASISPELGAAATLVVTAQSALIAALHATSTIGALSTVLMAVAVAVDLLARPPQRARAIVRRRV